MLRAEGFLPGMVYGQGENVPITVSAKEVKKVLEAKGGKNSIIKTKFDGDSKERVVMIKSLDVHPIYDTLLHIDLMEIDVTKRTKVNVPLEFTGTAIGVKRARWGHGRDFAIITAGVSAAGYTTSIEVPIDNMKIGDVWQVKDLKIDSKLTPLVKDDSRVVSISEPKAVEEVEEDELAAAGEDEGAEAPAEPESTDK